VVEATTVAQQMYGKKWTAAHAKQIAQATLHPYQLQRLAAKKSAARTKAQNVLLAAQKLHKKKKARIAAKWKESRTKSDERDEIALEEDAKKRDAWWGSLTDEYDHQNDAEQAKKNAEQKAKDAKQIAKNNAIATNWANKLGNRIADNLKGLKQDSKKETQAEEQKMSAARQLDALQAKLNRRKVRKVEQKMAAVHQEFVDALKNSKLRRQMKAKEMNGKAEYTARQEMLAQAQRDREIAARMEQEKKGEALARAYDAKKKQLAIKTAQQLQQQQQQAEHATLQERPHLVVRASAPLSVPESFIGGAADQVAATESMDRVHAAIAKAQREEQLAEARLQHDAHVKARAIKADHVAQEHHSTSIFKETATPQEIVPEEAEVAPEHIVASKVEQRLPDLGRAMASNGAPAGLAKARLQEQLAEERLTHDQQIQDLAVKDLKFDAKLKKHAKQAITAVEHTAMQGGYQVDHDACRRDCERMRHREQEEAREAAAQPPARHTTQPNSLMDVSGFDDLVEARSLVHRRLLQAPLGSECDCSGALSVTDAETMPTDAEGLLW